MQLTSDGSALLLYDVKNSQSIISKNAPNVV